MSQYSGQGFCGVLHVPALGLGERLVQEVGPRGLAPGLVSVGPIDFNKGQITLRYAGTVCFRTVKEP